jgi:hypothetical protein
MFNLFLPKSEKGYKLQTPTFVGFFPCVGWLLEIGTEPLTVIRVVFRIPNHSSHT